MKKWGLILVVLALLLMTACGQGGNNTDNSASNGNDSGGNNASGDKKVTLTILNNKVEISQALEKLKEEYESLHPNVKLEIVSVGGSADYNSALKAKFAAGQAPDIFMNKGDEEAKLWKDELLDLSGEPWVANMVDGAGEAATIDGQLLGMPVGIEGYGYIYNKDIFEQAGITELPKTLSELTAVAEKLKQQGIDAFSNGYQEYWILGNHLVNVALAKQDDPAQFMEDWKSGKVTAEGNPIFEDWINLVDLTVKYGQANPLTTDYNTQVTLFASGKTAMIQQGNWIQVTLDQLNPDLNIGFLPMPISDDVELNQNMFIGVPLYWVVHKNSPNVEQAKEFLNWLVSTEEGRKYIIQEFKFIPAFKDITYSEEDLGLLAASIQDYVQEGKTLGWYFSRLPVGANKEFAASIQAYIAGQIDKTELLRQFDKTIQSLASGS